MIDADKIHIMDNNNNIIIGRFPNIKNSSINFREKNNILYCEDNVKLLDSELNFMGDNSVIFLCSNQHQYKLFVKIFNDSVFYIGKNNYINNILTIRLSEQKHCFIGDNGMYSLNITIRNADPHLIYSCSTGTRINLSKSVFIGDHVWIGQDVRILKGTRIDSGSIIGAMSVISGKNIPHNSIWAGNPCKQINNDVFWDRSSVHNWTSEKTEKSMIYSEYIAEYKQDCHDDFWIYEYIPSECIDWNELEEHFSSNYSPLQKCEYLINLNKNKSKNRFVHSHI